MPIYVALLRGINVGGQNKIPMAALRELLESVGLHEVSTYIQSGNAVFRSAQRSPASVASRIEDAIATSLGLTVPTIVRTASQMAGVVAGNPFLARDVGVDPTHLHVGFLAEPPDEDASSRLGALDPSRFAPEEIELQGREIYLLLPDGVGRAKLSAVSLDRVLGAPVTLRNWKSVTTLANMATQRG